MTTTEGSPQSQTRPRAVAFDEAVVVDGEAVIFAGGELHQLNATATLVWQSCDGRVSLGALGAELADSFGADPESVQRDVENVVAGLRALDLVVVDAERDGGGHDELDHSTAQDQRLAASIIQPVPACSGCGSGPDYEQHILVAIGDGVASIGADTEVAAAIAAAFGPSAVGRVEPNLAPPSYGVVLPEPAIRSALQPVSLLYRGPDILFRSRDPERVLRALVAQVASHQVPTGFLALEGLVVGRAGRAVVIPVPANRVAFGRVAAREGLAVSDSPVALVAVDPLTVTCGPVGLDVHLEPLQRVATSRRSLGGETAPLPWDTYELAAIMVAGSPGPAAILGELALMGGSGSADPKGVLAGLRTIAGRVPVRTGVTPAAVAALIDAVPASGLG